MVAREKHMTAYVINQLSIHDTSYQKNYYAKVGAILERHGGKQIAGAPPAEKFEGEFNLPGRVTILEFPSLEHARAWWNDPEYESLKKARQACTTGRVLLVEGNN
jgi:uncharacterized protein (DUF1330 family)